MKSRKEETRGAEELATQTSDRLARSGAGGDALELALSVMHSDDPERVGEVLVVPAEGIAILGRGTSEAHLTPVRQRPGGLVARSPFVSPFLSRDQLRITRASSHTLRIENVGKAELVDKRGRDVGELAVGPGDAFAVGEHLVLLCIERPRELPRLRTSAALDTAFGDADAEGIVGESPTAWALRDTLAFVAARSAHVLLLGPSGSGKEIAAQAIHRLSSRRGRAMVSRNASTLPSGLIEAELFGNAANYPSHGMPERPGLVGEATGSILFLDEIGELSEELSTRLLRLLDERGDYQRLGDARRRTADLRVIGATNQPLSKLRADVGARFKIRINLPGLDLRREDIPLLVRHLMRKIASEDAVVADRFFDGSPRRLRIAPDLVLGLVSHSYKTHVRELEALLWLALTTSKGDELAFTPELRAELSSDGGGPRATQAGSLPSADDVRAALVRAGGVHEKAWRDLGLGNRYVFKRLVKKYGLS
jgi:DNA-binding NtrC family response regulator